ncbi:uncharacterized protein DNG_09646 [Cephalotrichum gorgonifer]|uniref:Zn(2)-C6 fungal-type domain-containing protein n=1 Tax=Cephalotrichum gorgonifer TaxID=2041049 RepID=A0AAE8N687_9PEZI|nr:uncharacterized protein DNG_09646 [Cephalotrichum gorgonifer]
MSASGGFTPDSGATPASAATPASTKAQRVLACVLCQHRKIKCDRNTPCSNCVKGNVRCTPSTPAPARKRRRPNQDLQERLARCEELLKSYASAASGETPGGNLTNPSDPAFIGNTAFAEPSAWPPAGKVVVEDGSTRYVDSVVWTSIHDELAEMRKIIDSDEFEDHSTVASEAVTPEDDASDLLLGDYASLSICDTYPEPVHAFRLWQIFLERVNPLVKVIHAPSVQPHIVEAASGTWNVPPNYKPLLFAIFNMGVFSLNDSECRQMLGMSRESALKKFSAGVRAALMEAHFMSTYDLCILQALVLYLVSLQGRRDKHAAWILSGVCVRIAQKMGLHRDGESLNLAPFETEMRRRLWWNLVMHDSALALMSGLSYSVISLHWTTKMPRNLNDAELFPGQTEPIQDREGPTEMGFSLLMCTIWAFIIKWHRDNPGFEAAIIGHDMAAHQSKVGGMADEILAVPSPAGKYNKVVDAFEEELMELRDKYIDPNAGPAHTVAWALPGILMEKMRDTLVPYTERPEYGVEVFTVRDNLFRMGISSLASSGELFDLLESNGFMWHHKLHFQVDLFTALVGQLMHRPTGSLADRAWTGIDIVYRYHQEIYDMTQRQHVTLRAFVIRAWKGRAKALAEQGLPVTVPVCVQELTKTFPGGRIPDSATPSSMKAQSPAAGGMGQDRGVNKWLPTTSGAGAPTLDGLGTGDIAFGGVLDMGPMDWDMFADSMSQEQGGLSSLGYPTIGTNIGNPW